MEERVTAAKCGVCGQPIKHGQLVSGARLTPDAQEVVGHYACIVQMLGSEKTLTAILAHQLPAIDVTTLVDGRVPGWERLFGDDPR
jgi:hypothetical protein